MYNTINKVPNKIFRKITLYANTSKLVEPIIFLSPNKLLCELNIMSETKLQFLN